MAEIGGRLLLVEDDENLGFLVKDSLEMAGFKVDLAANGEVGLSTFVQHPFDLCILDVMLPGKDGFSLAREIRNRNAQVPFLFLTARNNREDRIKGFELGADDYVSKPFGMEELVLRVKAILKRFRGGIGSPSIHQSRYQLGSLEFVPEAFQLIAPNDTKTLSRREAQLLTLFCSHPNEVLHRERIQKLIWEDEGYVVGRSLDVFVSKLRKYLQPEPTIKLVNLHGIGYKLEVTDSL